MSHFIFSINITLPLFLMIILGFILKEIQMINADFIKKMNFIIFHIALPVKLFDDISKADYSGAFDIKFLAFIGFGTIFITLMVWGISLVVVKDKKSVGAFVQGSFRGNFLYIGLSLMENLTGGIGLKAPIAIAIITPLYNILGVIALAKSKPGQKDKINVGDLLLKIIKNPLIISIFCGLIVSLLGIKIPIAITRTFGYLKVTATPMALIVIGASFEFINLKNKLKLSVISTILKTLFTPTLMLGFAYLLGFRNSDFLFIYVIFGVPTAATSYIMAATMEGDSELASSIIVLSTLVSIVTITLFITLFRYFHLI